MLNMKKMVVNHLYKVFLFMLFLILVLVIIIQIFDRQRIEQESAADRIAQIEQILEENERELGELKEEYSNTCLKNAEAIAYILQYRPEVTDSKEELEKLAELMEVDEIHIFDETGTIVKGTHPQYFGFSFDSGEQMQFFKPMLNDKSLRLCQDITPNTAEEKLMQYSALWSENGKFIVQVGMEPVNVMKVTEKNELSYIFSLLRAGTDVSLYAIDKESGAIKGATTAGDIGKSIADIGIHSDSLRGGGQNFHARVNGVLSYCILKESGSNVIACVTPVKAMYGEVVFSTILLAVSMVVIVVILVYAVSGYINKLVISGIDCMNEDLREISGGNLEKKVDIGTCIELSELSSHINEMVKSLTDSAEKIAYILNKGNMRIGVYEYNQKRSDVRFTDYVPRILCLTKEETARLSGDYREFQNYLGRLRENVVYGETGIFYVKQDEEIYVRLEELVRHHDTMGMIIDVTGEVQERRRLKDERDRDSLTGLLNRYGLENRLEKLLEQPECLEHAAVVMLDADGLKAINDRYGHEKGDLYLKQIAQITGTAGSCRRLAARWGGDEFVLVLYGYEEREALFADLDRLKHMQSSTMVELTGDLRVPLRFSLGISMFEGQKTCGGLVKEADRKMYEDKRRRRSDECL